MGRDEVIAWYQNTLSRHRRVVVVAGDVRARAVADLIQERLQSLRPLSTPQELPPREELRGVREAVETRAKQQTAMALAFPAPPPDAPEHPALVLLMEILSGSGGRLYSELRGRQSLAYSVGAFELGLTQENALVCTIAGDAAKEQASREGILRELDRLCRDGVSAEEVARAQAALLGRRAIGLQTLGARAGALAWAELKGVGVAGWQGLPRRYQEVTAGEVLEVARRYLVTDRYAIGIARGIGKG
jgi:zinc protease